MLDEQDTAAAWRPLFEDLAEHLRGQAHFRIAIYLREPFLGEYCFESSYPDNSERDIETEMVSLASRALADDDALHSIDFGSGGDILIGEYTEAPPRLRATTVLPFRINGEIGLSSVIAVSVADESRYSQSHFDNIAVRIRRHAGTLKMALRAHLLADERRLVLDRRGDTNSLLSNLVPDAFASTRARIAACAVIEGESRLANRIAFARVSSAVSPRLVSSIAHRNLYQWSLGRPRTLFGLGSTNEPRWPLGRLATNGRFALFGLHKNFTPAKCEDFALVLPSVGFEDCSALPPPDNPFSTITRHMRIARAARRVIGHLADFGNTSALLMRDPTEMLLGGDLSVWCLAEKRLGAALVDWNFGHGFLGGFSVRDSNGDSPLCDADVTRWKCVIAEISDPLRGAAWNRALAALVEYSSLMHEDCTFEVHQQQLWQIVASKRPIVDVHGQLLTDGTTVRLRWQHDKCVLDIERNEGAVRSIWQIAERYWPVATAAAPLGSISAQLADPEFKYPPAQSHIMLTTDQALHGERWRPRGDMWRSDHARVITESVASAAELWLDDAETLIGVPLGRSAHANVLSFDEWCSSGAGPRRMLLAALPHAVPLPEGELQDLVGFLQTTQEHLALDTRRHVRDLDRVLVEHVRHDLGVLRSGFDVISEVASHVENSSHDDRKLRHAIRDIYDRLSGLEMITGLYERIDSPYVVALRELEGSITVAIQLGAARARRKLKLDSSHDERLMNTVVFDPPPPSREVSTPDALAVLVLENVIGNAICAAEVALNRGEKTVKEQTGDMAVRVDVTDGTVVVRNRCRPESWEYARQELKSGFPRSIGLAVVIQAAQIGGMRVVSGDSGPDVAEVHLIPFRGAI